MISEQEGSLYSHNMEQFGREAERALAQTGGEHHAREKGIAPVSFRKTRRMLEIEANFGSLKDLLQKSYVDEEKSINAISRDTGVNQRTLRKWLTRFGFSIRSASEAARICGRNPETRRRVSESITRLWAENPERKKRMSESQRLRWVGPDREGLIERLQSPEAKEKRSESGKKSWERNPERKIEFSSRMKTVSEREVKENMEKALGNNPKAALEDMYWRQGLSTAQIAETIDRSITTINEWMKKLGILKREKGNKGIASMAQESREIFQKAVETNALGSLPERDRKVLELRFSGVPFSEIGKRLGISKQFVHFIERRAIKKLLIRRLMVNLSNLYYNLASENF